MKFKKRGVGLMIFGAIVMFVTLVPVVTKTNAANVIVHIAGWGMILVGAMIRGKQKKEQKNLEQAMYQWADSQTNQQKSERQPWFCPNCGTQGKGNFCENCGTPKPRGRS